MSMFFCFIAGSARAARLQDDGVTQRASIAGDKFLYFIFKFRYRVGSRFLLRRTVRYVLHRFAATLGHTAEGTIVG